MAKSNAFKGITFRADTNKWEAYVHAKAGSKSRKLTFGAIHDTPEAAAHHRDIGAYLIRGEDADFNLPHLMTAELKAKLDGFEDEHAYLAERKQESEARQDARYRKGSSRYRGVSWEAVNREDAARCYDHIQIHMFGSAARTNFPLTDYPAELAAHEARIVAGEAPAAVKVSAPRNPNTKLPKPQRKRSSAAARSPAGERVAAVASQQLEVEKSECSSTASEEGSPSSAFHDTSDSGEDWGELAAEAALLDDDQMFCEQYASFWTAARRQRFLDEYGHLPRPDWLEVEQDNLESCQASGFLAAEVRFMYCEQYGLQRFSYAAALDDWRQQRILQAQEAASAAAAAVGTPQERSTAQAAQKDVELMEEELPPEWELYLQAVTAVQERWAAEQAAQEAMDPVERYAAAKLAELTSGLLEDRQEQEDHMAQLRRLEAELPAHLEALATLEDEDLARTAADQLVTGLLEARRVAEARGWDVEERAAEEEAALRRLLGLAAGDGSGGMIAAEVAAQAAAIASSISAGGQQRHTASCQLTAGAAAGAAATADGSASLHAAAAALAAGVAQGTEIDGGAGVQRRMADVAALAARVQQKEYEAKRALRALQFRKLCVFWEGKVVAALRAKNVAWVQHVLGPDWRGRLERSAAPCGPPLFGTHGGVATLPPAELGLGDVMSEITGAIPTAAVSEGLGAALVAAQFPGAAQPMVPALDDVVLANWYDRICQQAAAGQPMAGFGPGGEPGPRWTAEPKRVRWKTHGKAKLRHQRHLQEVVRSSNNSAIRLGGPWPQQAQPPTTTQQQQQQQGGLASAAGGAAGDGAATVAAVPGPAGSQRAQRAQHPWLDQQIQQAQQAPPTAEEAQRLVQAQLGQLLLQDVQ